MGRLRAFVTASHPGPTAAVTVVMSAYAWSIGWRGAELALVALTVLIGQLSIGWSNDAFDARLDAQAGRTDKPTVTAAVSVPALWIAATTALVAASVLSWVVAGPVGGSFHVFALAMAWLYNVALSRTVWSWLPYALAFGAFPAFLYVGLDGSGPPWWAVAAFAIIAVSAHLANALPDAESDRSLGAGGLVVRIGARRATWLCWLLLALGTAILVGVTFPDSPWTAAVLVAAYVGALAYGTWSHRRGAMFIALIVAVVVDVVAVIASAAV